MSLVLLQKRRELNKRKLAALAFLARSADVEEWPERLEGLAKKADALGNESLVRSLVQEVVQVVATEGTLPKMARPATKKNEVAPTSDKEAAGERPEIPTGKA